MQRSFRLSASKFLIISTLMLIAEVAAAQGDTLRVLFLGNSYTAANNLPQLVTDVAASAGDAVIQANNTPGGYTFQMHSVNPQSVSLIQQGGWDYMILQEQSQLPSFPIQQVEAECFPYAKYLDSLFNVHNPCGETVYYRTWGRKYGDLDNCPNWPPVCTYAGMDSLLNLRYRIMADSFLAVLSPVGNVWKYLRTNNPGIELYVSDNSHPSEAGSYVAACCMYTVLFRRSPLGITYNFNLSAADALTIRNAVKTIVYDSLPFWNTGLYDPAAHFSVWIENPFIVHFFNTSAFSTEFSWDFGDGTYSNLQDPVHTYANAGDYSVKLVAGACGISDSIIQNIHLDPIGIADREQVPVGIAPNPATTEVVITCALLREAGTSILLTNSQGLPLQEMPAGKDLKLTLSLESLPAGMYFIRIQSPGATIPVKFIKAAGH